MLHDKNMYEFGAFSDKNDRARHRPNKYKLPPGRNNSFYQNLFDLYKKGLHS